MLNKQADHIVKSFDEELKHLNNIIAEMGGLAEAQLDRAVECLVRRNSELAAQVVKDDKRIDNLETEVGSFTVRLLALRQPMAQDLREVVAAIKIASDIERIGDYAKNIAKRAIVLAQYDPLKPAASIPRMSRLALTIIKDVLDAYAQNDVRKAQTVWMRDEEVDDMYNSLFRELITYMMEDPRNITACTHLMFMAKNIERIGDYATNIAEIIHFKVEGKEIGEPRPKGSGEGYAQAGS